VKASISAAPAGSCLKKVTIERLIIGPWRSTATLLQSKPWFRTTKTSALNFVLAQFAMLYPKANRPFLGG
jgi:hypothetical protein